MLPPQLIYDITRIFIIILIIWRVGLMLSLPSYPSTPLRFTDTTTPQIITYNIQSLPHYSKDIARIYDSLREYDIICLQECFQSMWFNSSRIQRQFGENFHIARATLTKSSMKIIDSGLIILSKFPIVTTEFHPFSWYRGVASDSLAEKGWLSAVLRLPSGKLNVICTHLQASYTAKMENMSASKKQLKEIFRSNLKPKYPTIIAGDFNMSPNESRDIIEHTGYNVFSGMRPTTYILYGDDGGELRCEAHQFHVRCRPYELDFFIASPGVMLEDIEVINYGISDHVSVSGKIGVSNSGL
jgi:endonuclease/exonuclease/phosphatase family metal-dependent hydrolase